MMHRAPSRALGMFLGVVLRGSAVGAVAGALVTTAILLTGPDASAKSSFDSAYGFDRTWNAALRMVRVDMNLKITEKDEQSGYLLFEYKSQESQKPSSGSMEFIRGRDADSPVHVVVQLPQMPKYHEQVLVDDLARKLRNEYGEAPRRKPTPAPIDAGADGS